LNKEARAMQTDSIYFETHNFMKSNEWFEPAVFVSLLILIDPLPGHLRPSFPLGHLLNKDFYHYQLVEWEGFGVVQPLHVKGKQPAIEVQRSGSSEYTRAVEQFGLIRLSHLNELDFAKVGFLLRHP
jgi:hypothetical protein